MGLLVNGEWRDVWYDTAKTGGKFERQEAGFRNWVTPDGSPGPSGQGGFKLGVDLVGGTILVYEIDLRKNQDADKKFDAARGGHPPQFER